MSIVDHITKEKIVNTLLKPEVMSELAAASKSFKKIMTEVVGEKRYPEVRDALCQTLDLIKKNLM
jgi:hypothetical protein